ncbi:MAG TPA: VTT domain-containing protein, partial [Stellaceae bacterium]|nr:VTT domain-containing protein [Stellaceae bacterium]
ASALNRALRLAVTVLLLLAAAVLWRWRGLADPRAMTAVVARYPATPLVFLAVQVAASLLFVPRTLLGVVAGLLFGSWWGTLWAALGSLAGAVAGFLAARYVNSGLVDLESDRRIGPFLQRVERGGWRVVALVRLVPILPHSLTNYALGLTRLPLSSYAVGSALGQMPLTIACVTLGTAGGRLVGGDADWLAPSLIAAAALGLSFLIPAFARRQRPAPGPPG